MIYILEYSRNFYHARFYVGMCANGRLEMRVAEHRAGQGAKINAAAARNGIGMQPVLVFPQGNRSLEILIKRKHNTPRLIAKLRKQGLSGSWEGYSYKFMEAAS